MAGETPVILSREVYVTAALVAAFVYVALMLTGASRSLAMVSGFTAGFALRAVSLYWGWSLPRYKARPPGGLPPA